jgi:hypothetical protein
VEAVQVVAVYMQAVPAVTQGQLVHQAEAAVVVALL